MSAPALTVLEPNAMVVHLIVHMDGHRGETGPMLLWILDVAFVLRKWGALLEPERIERLMPAIEHFVSLFRTIRFLEREFDEKLPECLVDAAKKFEPFTLFGGSQGAKIGTMGFPFNLLPFPLSLSELPVVAIKSI